MLSATERVQENSFLENFRQVAKTLPQKVSELVASMWAIVAGISLAAGTAFGVIAGAVTAVVSALALIGAKKAIHHFRTAKAELPQVQPSPVVIVPAPARREILPLATPPELPLPSAATDLAPAAPVSPPELPPSPVAIDLAPVAHISLPEPPIAIDLAPARPEKLPLANSRERSVQISSPAPGKPSAPQRAPYAPQNDDHKPHITFIVTFIKEHNPVELGVMREKLYQRGALIEHIHPFAFLETIFSEASLHQHMRPIWDSLFKRMGFMKGVKKGMKKNENTLLHHLPAFANRLKVSAALLKPLIESREWGKFVLCLIQNVPFPSS